MYRAVLRSQPDRALATLAAGGSEPAFEAIVLRYRRPLLGYCRRLRLSESRSEDVVQQTFINAWGSLQHGVEVQDLRPWLYRITHNQAVSMLRRPGADDASLTDLLDHPSAGPGLFSPSSSVEEIVERQARLRETLTAVADLPVLQREALLATAVDGLSYEQVAVALNTTGDAVRGLVYRARNHLRTGVAAISPAPLVVWAAQHTGQPVTAALISEWLTGAGAVAGPAGLGGAAVKGAAVVASSAAVVGGTVGAGLAPGLLGAGPHPAPAPSPVAGAKASLSGPPAPPSDGPASNWLAGSRRLAGTPARPPSDSVTSTHPAGLSPRRPAPVAPAAGADPQA